LSLNWPRVIASGFGSGLFPVAPGTAGSLAALVVGAGLFAISPWLVAAAAIAAFFGGIWAVRRGVTGDPGWVVIDEFAGQWIAMLGMGTLGWWQLAAAFGLFRLFDIRKPGPVGWADRWHTPVGVMADDLFAGVLAAGVLSVGRWASADFFN